MDWVVYILKCSDGSLYTGITNNIEFLPPYFNILDSLSSQYSEEDSLNPILRYSTESILFTESE